jgi:hypothetical protein
MNTAARLNGRSAEPAAGLDRPLAAFDERHGLLSVESRVRWQHGERAPKLLEFDPQKFQFTHVDMLPNTRSNWQGRVMPGAAKAGDASSIAPPSGVGGIDRGDPHRRCRRRAPAGSVVVARVAASAVLVAVAALA